MRATSEEAADAISFIESADLHRAKINAIREWPGLSGAQRAAALVLVCLQHADTVGMTFPDDVAAFLAISTERAEKLFDGVEHPPFELQTVGAGRAGWQPSQTLEYGE